MFETQIRKLTQNDWEIFSAIRLRALKECPGFFGSNYEKEQQYTQQEWQGWLGRGDAAMFGLFDGDQLVGITGVVTDRINVITGVVIAVYILPGYRGRGLSEPLNKACIEWAKAYKSWNKLLISHREDNEASRRANQRHGFVFTHRSSKTWPDGVTSDDLHYELDLEELRKRA